MRCVGPGRLSRGDQLLERLARSARPGTATGSARCRSRRRPPRRRRGSPAGGHRAGRARSGTRRPRWRRRRRCRAAAPTATGTSWGYRHTAATDGTSGRVGSGRTALAHSATILPAVSLPSRVVRSMHRIARSSAQTLRLPLDRPGRERRGAPLQADGVHRVVRATIRAASDEDTAGRASSCRWMGAASAMPPS